MLLFHSSENAASFYGARRGILFGLPSIIVYASLEILDEKKRWERTPNFPSLLSLL
jgi:hypothetical protein